MDSASIDEAVHPPADGEASPPLAHPPPGLKPCVLQFLDPFRSRGAQPMGALLSAGGCPGNDPAPAADGCQVAMRSFHVSRTLAVGGKTRALIDNPILDFTARLPS